MPGAIKQTVTGLNVGKKAVMSLRFGSNGGGIILPACPASLNKPLRITVRDSSNAVIFTQIIATGAFDVRAGIWCNFVANFIAPSTSLTLEFESLFNDQNCSPEPGKSYYGPSLDNIYLGLPPEICGNGIDDDGDGAIDGFDPECFLPPVCNGNLIDNIFTLGSFGSVSKNGQNAALQPDPANNPGVILGNPLPNNFTAYNFGFYSNYLCATPNNCFPGFGSYVITNSTNGMFHSPSVVEYWSEFKNNSSEPDGYMMVVDAAIEPGIFYQQIVPNICSNTSYQISLDVRNLFTPNFEPFGPDIHPGGFPQALPNIDIVIAPRWYKSDLP